MILLFDGVVIVVIFSKRLFWPSILLVTLVILVNVGIIWIASDFRKDVAQQIRNRVIQPTSTLVHGPARGFALKEFVDDRGIAHRYAVFIPYGWTVNDPLPILMYLNGFGKNGSDGIAPLLDGLAPSIWGRRYDFPLIVIWPQCPSDGSWVSDGVSAQRALAILRKTSDEFHGDPNRVYLTGLSSGGAGVWSIAASHPELFAAIVPISSHVSARDLQKVIDAKLPVWSFSVVEDDSSLVESNQRAHNALLDAGVDSHHTEVSTNGVTTLNAHDAWSFAFRDSALYRWMLSHTHDQRSFDEKTSQTLRQSTDHSMSSLELTSISPDLQVLTLPIVDISRLCFEFRANSAAQSLTVGAFAPADSTSSPGKVVNVSLDGNESGGVFEWPTFKCQTAAAPVAERAVLKQWNELQLDFKGDRLSVTLNGWLLLEDAEFETRQNDVFGILSRHDDTEAIEIRNIEYHLRDKAKSFAKEHGRSDERSDQGSELITTSVLNLDKVFLAWRERENQCKNVQICWNLKRSNDRPVEAFRSTASYEKSGDSGMSDRMELTPHGFHYEAPWCYSQVRLTRKFGLKGNTSHREFLQRLESISSSSDASLSTDRLEIFADERSRNDQVSSDKRSGRKGVVFKSSNPWRDRVGSMDDLFWRGPLIAFRPLSRSGIGIQYENCRIREGTVCVGGSRCTVVEELSTVDSHRFVRRFYCDAARDFLILRYILEIDGKRREQIDTQYSQHQDHGWIPDSWTIIANEPEVSSVSESFFPGHELLFDCAEAHVEACLIDATDTSQPHAGFQAGCLVFDQVTGEWHRQGPGGKQVKMSPNDVIAANADEPVAEATYYRTMQLGLFVVLLALLSLRFARNWTPSHGRVPSFKS